MRKVLPTRVPAVLSAAQSSVLADPIESIRDGACRLAGADCGGRRYIAHSHDPAGSLLGRVTVAGEPSIPGDCESSGMVSIGEVRKAIHVFPGVGSNRGGVR